MAFRKLKFKEIHHENGQVDYLIENKYVTKEVFDSIFNDESLFVIPPLPKVIISPENSYDDGDNKNNRDSQRTLISNRNDQQNLQKQQFNQTGAICNCDNKNQGIICDCDYCQQMLSIVRIIKELDDKQALEEFKDCVELLKAETKMETMIKLYNEIGNNMHMASSKIELRLNDFLNQEE
jgi:hypothetical protein